MITEVLDIGYGIRKNNMALDKSVVKRLAVQANKYLIEDEVFFQFCTDFAQAIYELGYGDGASNDINAQTNYNRGVQDERERAVLIIDAMADAETVCDGQEYTDKGLHYYECAEAIRKG